MIIGQDNTFNGFMMNVQLPDTVEAHALFWYNFQCISLLDSIFINPVTPNMPSEVRLVEILILK